MEITVDMEAVKSSKRLINIEIESVEQVASSLLHAAAKIEMAMEKVGSQNLSEELTKFNSTVKELQTINLETYSLRLTSSILQSIRDIDLQSIQRDVFDSTVVELKKLSGITHIAIKDILIAETKLAEISAKLEKKMTEFETSIQELVEIDQILKELKEVKNLQKSFRLKNTAIIAALTGVSSAAFTYIYMISHFVK